MNNHWTSFYREIAKSLVNFYNSVKNKNEVGRELYERCMQDKRFFELNKSWIEKFGSNTWNIKSLDPIHIFASINSNKLGSVKRVQRVNVLLRILN